MLKGIDDVRLHFAPEYLWLLHLLLAFIMFGVALTLKPEDFRRIALNPKASILGIVSQFFLLPLVTLGLIWLVRPLPSIGLGLFLVAACPGGNMSNFITLLAKGNTALSVSLTAVATLLAIVMTPLNFTFWAGLYPGTAELLKAISVDPLEMVIQVIILLGLPLVAGMLLAIRFPRLAARIMKPIHRVSILIFALFLLVAFLSNWNYFVRYMAYVVILVLVHNGLALFTGYSWAWVWGLPKRDRRTLSIETGIQNTGLGLVLVFGFFSELGGMAVIAGWWGIWDLLAGLLIAYIWSKRNPVVSQLA